MSENLPIIGVCGPSGSGKSTSLENLPKLFPNDPNAVQLLDGERKGYPWRKNLFKTRYFDTYGKFDVEFKGAIKEGAKIIVIESWLKFTHFAHEFSNTSFKGFDVFKNFGRYQRLALESVKQDKAIVIFTGINEAVTTEAANDNGSDTVDKVIDCFASCTGKEMRGKVEPEMLIVLHTIVNTSKNAPNEHLFLTTTDGVKTAKSPAWMQLPRTVPNDLAPIVRCILENKSWTELNASK